jgi:CheY-like chemotaxis protein
MRLAQLHGGSVALESSPDAGSRFSVTLPWAPPTVRADALDTAPVMIPKVLGIEDSPMMAEQLRESPQGITAQVAVYERAVGTVEQQPLLLLVDDNQANIDLLMDYVPTAGYQVAVAHNGVEALARVEELQPSLILMDIQMPVLDGLEAIRHIRATGMNHTPIIALTALAMRGDRERCLAAGANAYIPKPVSIHSLLATIAEQLSVP